MKAYWRALNDALAAAALLASAALLVAPADAQDQSGVDRARPSLHVLAIGIDRFRNAPDLQLSYADWDARGFADALRARGQSGLYAEVSVRILLDEEATRSGILEAMAAMAETMRSADTSAILFSTHSAVDEGRFYLIPQDVDLSSSAAMRRSAISADEIREGVRAIAKRGRVLLFFDTHSGTDSSLLRTALSMENVTVLTSSRQSEVSQELSEWKHGAFTKALLDGLGGGADPNGRGVISTPELVKGVSSELEALTDGKQHLGLDVNFLGDVFPVTAEQPTLPAAPAPSPGLKPAGALYVLAIGIDHFGAKAGKLHLDFAVDDAKEVVKTLLDSQNGRSGKAPLYTNVSPLFLHDEGANPTAILDAMDAITKNMSGNPTGQDTALILFSGHGELIENKYYLIPYGVDVSTNNRMERTSLWVEDFAAKVKLLAERGKVLLLLDACRSGAVGPGGSSAILDPSALRNAINMDNVAVLTSSKSKDEESYESADWKHGAFTQAFLDAIAGAAHPDNSGRISLLELTKAMGKDLDTLTHGRPHQQHLGLHINFEGDVFLVNR